MTKQVYCFLFFGLLSGCDRPAGPLTDELDQLEQRRILAATSPKSLSPSDVKRTSTRKVELQLANLDRVPMRVVRSSPEGGLVDQSHDGEATVPMLPFSEQGNVKATLATARRFAPTIDCQDSGSAHRDAWGSQFSIQCLQGEIAVELTSFGPDKQLGTRDDILWRQPLIKDSDASDEQTN